MSHTNTNNHTNAPYAAMRPWYIRRDTAVNDIWWLRSPGNNANSAAVVNDAGNVNANGNNVDNDNLGVRPDLSHRSKRAPKLVPSMPGQRCYIPALYRKYRANTGHLVKRTLDGFRFCLWACKIIGAHSRWQ